ncbi:hypothetical protein [Geodermatophilus chilensis]|uniref:hypothetical protein n=1 Tax=Geodermatophilus chilensis TaxID=2035835 RepID=UPI000C259A26|nr:hypothetical protein [Geodermatophilus chilensis]
MSACEGPAPARTGPNENAAAKQPLAAERSAAGRHPDPAAWAATVSRQPLSRAARTVAGQLADRARGGRVRTTPAEIAECTCLRVVEVYAALADLGSRQLVARDGRGAYVLTHPGSAR